jgi:ubiquinol-cytochrome c reductase cytochrome b subunit
VIDIRAWLRERTGATARTPSTIAGGPSFAYVFGWVLVMLFGLEAVTGAALAAFYSPSTTSAWASVAYVQDQMPLGWLVRGLHFHGASAIVIVAGIHLLQTAVFGAYKKPRELVWWLGILLLMIVLGWAVTGYVLRWDQAGYWANRVEVGIAAGTPLVGGAIRALAIGGNEYGNLTLTRFYTLHVMVMPALVAGLVAAHVWLARKHGATPRAPSETATPRWPAQSLRNVIAMAVVFAVLLGYVIAQDGADLAAPADPSAAYDARPLWYFRWLFELRVIAGSFERFAALAAPAVVAGFLVMLPLIDRTAVPDASARKRLPFIAGVGGLLAVIGALTLASFAGDHADGDLADRQEAADKLATRARALAAKYGVPATGAQDVYFQGPMGRARDIYTRRCKGCHDATSKDRKGPIIGPGHGNRDWLHGFLKAPSSEPYWGHTKLAKTDDAMKSVELSEQDLGDLTELLYAQSGAGDVDAARRDRGSGLFDKTCTDCHAIGEGVAGQSAPSLGGVGSRDYYTQFIGNPKSAVHMGNDKSEMPRFDKDLSIADRDALAAYLVWLRTATQQDLDRLATP